MSFVTSAMFQNFYTATRLDNQYSQQRNNQELMNMMGNSQGINPEQALRREQQITFTSLTNWLMAKYAEKAEQALDKQKKKDIEQSFNTFA